MTRTHDGHAPEGLDGCVVNSPLAMHVVQASLKPGAGLEELVHLARGDATLTLKALALVNSKTFGLPHSVTNVREAAALLGVRGLRNVALSLAVGTLQPRTTEGDARLLQARRRAVVAQQLAVVSSAVDPEEAYTCGLLLELGTLAQQDEDATGARVLAASGLPDGLQQAIAHHHDKFPPAANLSRLAWATHAVAALWDAGPQDVLWARAAHAAATLGVDEAALRALVAAVPHAVQQLAAADPTDDPAVSPEMLRRLAHQRVLDLNTAYELELRHLGSLTEALECLNVELAKQAGTDALTGLVNRRTFQDALVRDCARALRDATPLSLVVLDLDHFKKVQQTCGQSVGDVALQQVAAVLRQSVRQGDLAGRTGGDVFAVILPNTKEAGAAHLAQRIAKAVGLLEVPAGATTLKLSVGVGVACLAPPTQAPPQAAAVLFELAQQSLQAANKARNALHAARQVTHH